jgi:serine/threonine protein phosphatase 1
LSRFVIGDVHGQFDGLMLLLEQIKVSADDQIFFLGDLIDRGAQSAEVVDWVIKNRHSCIMGNHEQMCIESFARPNSSMIWQGWLVNGGSRTLESYGREGMSSEHLNWMMALPLYLDLGDFWLVHAGLDPKLSISAQSSAEFCWIREPFHSSTEPYFYDKTIVTGHTITFVFGGLKAGDIAQGAGWLGIDTGGYHPKSGWLTALNLDSSMVYQANTFTKAVRSLSLEEASVPVNKSINKSVNKKKLVAHR